MKKVVLLLLLTMVLSFTAATSAFALDSYEPNNTRATATPVTWYVEVCYDLYCMYPGWWWYSNVDSYISSPTDEDWYYYNNYYDVIYLSSPTGYDYDFYVYDHNGVLLASSTATAAWEEIRVPSGVDFNQGFYVKVVSKNGMYDLNTNYNLDLHTDL